MSRNEIGFDVVQAGDPDDSLYRGFACMVTREKIKIYLDPTVKKIVKGALSATDSIDLHEAREFIRLGGFSGLEMEELANVDWDVLLNVLDQKAKVLAAEKIAEKAKLAEADDAAVPVLAA